MVCGGGCSQFGLGCSLGWAAAVGGLGLEEVGAVVGGGQWAGGVAAGEAVAQVGDEAVGGVAQGERDVAGERGELGPGCGELGEAGEDGGGAGEDAGLAVGGGGEDEDGVGGGFRLAGVEVCGGEEGLGGGGVGWGEAEAVVAVAAEEPADGGVAEGAVAVEEDEQAVAERVMGGHGWLDGAEGRVDARSLRAGLRLRVGLRARSGARSGAESGAGFGVVVADRGSSGLRVRDAGEGCRMVPPGTLPDKIMGCC